MADQRQKPIDGGTIWGWIIVGGLIFYAVSWISKANDEPANPVPAIRFITNNPSPAYEPTGLDLYNCVDVGHQVYVGAYDPDNLDADGDGYGCDGW